MRIKKSIVGIFLFALLLAFSACSDNEAGQSSAAGAASDVSQAVSQPEGNSDPVVSKNITLSVINAEGEEKTFAIATDAENLRDALEQEGLIQGDDSEYGLFVKTVDGVTADDGNQEWWCLTKGGEMWSYGVDATEVADGDVFEFTLTVGY